MNNNTAFRSLVARMPSRSNAFSATSRTSPQNGLASDTRISPEVRLSARRMACSILRLSIPTMSLLLRLRRTVRPRR